MKKNLSQPGKSIPEARNTKGSKTPTIKDMPFSRLVEEHKGLAEARRAYASKPSEERRVAAEWEYDSSAGAEIFDRMLAALEKRLPRENPWYQVCLCLAIDPLYGPAMLSLGSLEYQHRRIGEAMKLFLGLVDLPEDTEDLPKIIDEAGDFLIDQKDFENAALLYRTAAQKYQNTALYHSALGYCCGKLGLHNEAVLALRKALELAPDSYVHLNDLGWSLTEAGMYEEARVTLKRAVALAPKDYTYARNNLKILEKRRKEKKHG